MSEPTGARQALTQQIAAQVHAATGDAEAAQAKAAAIVETKRSRTRAGVGLLAVTAIVGGLSFALHLSSTVTVAIVAVGCLWAGVTISPEYLKASAKDLGLIIREVASALKGAKSGD